ncbi:NodT family efflux transporter outer membrane factor (OMF) lipoprotein [Rhizomicrobium palustre]|uniref:NodT family efflux transporter outer membrane factor (OMF) lipoprotein n=1 Tax=Rhizomicrobium palustre TaxID=189966 RepID=A0A846MV82_9PROT|nr:efflux transporter outer membrane subunit [Rhizomicrobium palustre]NIK87273.1 NodT family efflux transporter outer membrane factor (OMF) lipoprotein [Rhizomicrobium palustre]
MKILFNSVSVVVLAFALTACATTPPEPIKAEDMPKAYEAPVPVADQEVTAEWWKSLSTPELTALIEEAHTGNLDLATAAARVEQAQAQAGTATATLFPSLNATYSAKRQGVDKTSPLNPAKASNSFGLTGAASYELDIFGGNVNSVRAARDSSRAAIYYHESVRLSTDASVANSYFAVLALRERIDIARRNVEAAKRILAITQAKVQNGVLSNLELAQQTSTVLGVEANIPRLEELEREQRNALAILVGRMPGALKVEAASVEGLTVPAVKSGIPATLLTRRPDVAQAEASLLSAHANLDAARAAFLPGVSLSAGGGWSNTVMNGLISPQNLAWNIGASVVQSIFDGGRLTSQRDYYKGRENELVASYKAAVLSALNDTETQLGSVTSYSEQERLTTEQVKNAQEAFRISELQYREGVVDLLTVLQAQQTLFSAQDTLIQIKLARLQAGVGLYRALGGGWDVKQDEDKPLRNTFIPVPDFTDLPIGLPF